MTRFWWTLGFILFLIETYSIFPIKNSAAKPSTGTHYVSGIFHAHSNYSDGSGTIPEIASAAKASGHQFVIVTDHSTAEGRRKGLDKEFDGVDAFVEIEATTPSGNLVVFSSLSSAANLSDEAQGKLGYEHFLGQSTPDLFVSIAHPSHVKHPWTQLEKFPDGMEIGNLDSFWHREITDAKLGFMGTLILAPFNSFLAAMRFFQFYPKDLLAWDNMNSVNPGHFGIFASEAHAKLTMGGTTYLKWPPYEETFRLASNIVFLKDTLASTHEDRKKQIYDSIRHGRLATIFQTIYPFEGNDFFLRCNEGTFRPGDSAPLSSKGCEYVVKMPEALPYPHSVRFIKDGEIQKEFHNAGSEVSVSAALPGTYRAEVWVEPQTRFHLFLHRAVPYLIYNPIYMR